MSKIPFTDHNCTVMGENNSVLLLPGTYVALHYRSCGLVSLTSRRMWRSLPNGSMMVLWSGLTHGSSDTPLSGGCPVYDVSTGSAHCNKCSPAGRHVLIGVWRVPDSELTDAG